MYTAGEMGVKAEMRRYMWYVYTQCKECQKVVDFQDWTPQ